MSGLLVGGLVVFGVGVAMNLLGGEDLRTIALVVQVAGAAMLFANAARSRRDAMRDPNDDPASPRDE